MIQTAQLEPWSYGGDPSKNPKDGVRYLVGDILGNDRQRRDTEIQWAVDENGGNLYIAAAVTCDSLAAQYSREADESQGEIRTQKSQRATAYAARAAYLRGLAATGVTGIASVAPFTGGVSITRQAAADADTDNLPSGFRQGMFDAV